MSPVSVIVPIIEVLSANTVGVVVLTPVSVVVTIVVSVFSN